MATVAWAEQMENVPITKSQGPARRDVVATLNYYRDPGDGSSPTPVYVGKYVAPKRAEMERSQDLQPIPGLRS